MGMGSGHGVVNVRRGWREFLLPLIVLAGGFLASGAARAGCTTPKFSYTIPRSHINVHQYCDSVEEGREACNVLGSTFKPYYGFTEWCNFVDKNGASYGYGGNYLIDGKEPYYWLSIDVGPESAADPDKNRGDRNCEDQCFGDPVNAGLANFYHQKKEVSGYGALPLEFSWMYNSTGTSRYIPDSMLALGRKRAFSYSQMLVRFDLGGNGQVSITRPDGNAVSFFLVEGEWQPERGYSGSLSERLPGGAFWTLHREDGLIEGYSEDGLLVDIRNNEGGRLLISRNSLGSVSRVDDQSGRSLLFEYGANERLVALTDPELRRYQFEYSPAGDLVLVRYPGGDFVQYKYDESGLISSAPSGLMTGVVDELGRREVTVKYDSNGRAIYVSNSSGNGGGSTASYINDPSSTFARKAVIEGGKGLRREIEFFVVAGVVKPKVLDEVCDNCASVSKTFNYDARGNLIEVNWSGRKSSIEYNDRNLPDVLVESDGSGLSRTTLNEWHPVHRAPVRKKVLDESGALMSDNAWSYNERGQVVGFTARSPDGLESRSTALSYCEMAQFAAGECPRVGLLTAVDGPRSDVADITTYTYYPSDAPGCAISNAQCSYRKGDLWIIQDALGLYVEVSAYDGSGRPQRFSDKNGVVSEISRDRRGLLTSRRVVGVEQQLTKYEYLKNGLMSRVVLPDGTSTSYSYDSANRLTDVVDGFGDRLHFELDVDGMRIRDEVFGVDGVLRYTSSRNFNARGEVWEETDSSGRSSQSKFDEFGNVVRETDRLGRIATYAVDGRNRSTSSVIDLDGISATARSHYDGLDRLSGVIDPNGIATMFTYSNFGELASIVSPDSGLRKYKFDSAGNAVEYVDAQGRSVTRIFDAINRPVEVNFSADMESNIVYQYDLPGVHCKVGEAYSAGKLSKVIEAGVSTSFCYNSFGDLTRKVQSVGEGDLQVSYGRDPSGGIRSMEYPDGMIVDFSHDASGRVIEVGVQRKGEGREILLRDAKYYPFGPLQSWNFGSGRAMSRRYDSSYRIASIEGGVNGISARFSFDAEGNVIGLTAGSPSLALSYDGMNRLLSVSDADAGVVIDSYEYDATGNRLSYGNANGGISYLYGVDSHRLLSSGAVERAYDAGGNLTSIGSDTRYVYDVRGRLEDVQRGGVSVARYRYNANGQQIERSGAGGLIQVLFDEDGKWLGDYSHDGSLIMQAIWMGARLVGLVDGQSLYYVETDHLGTPRAVVDAVRDVPVWSWDLKGEAFGSTAPDEDPDGDGRLFQFDMRFAGQRYDERSGLYYNYNRDYEPQTGRYIQSDPIGLAAGFSTYSYVDSNPLAKYDPLGLAAYRTEPLNYEDPDLVASIHCVRGKVAPYIDLKKVKHYTSSMGECIGGCYLAHEMSHVRDAEQSNPGVCQYFGFLPVISPYGGVTFPNSKGAQGGYSEYLQSEFRAHAEEMVCLAARLRKRACTDGWCLRMIEERMMDISETFLPSLRKGTYGIKTGR